MSGPAVGRCGDNTLGHPLPGLREPPLLSRFALPFTDTNRVPQFNSGITPQVPHVRD